MKVKGIDLNGNETEFEVESKKTNKNLNILNDLERLLKIPRFLELVDSFEFRNNLDILEAELKRLEELDKIMPKMDEYIANKLKLVNESVDILKGIIVKKDEILRIIKEGIVATSEYTTITWNGKKYIELTSYIEEKEFDLIKEVIKEYE